MTAENEAHRQCFQSLHRPDVIRDAGDRRAIDENVCVTARDQEAVCANEAMAMRLRDPKNSIFDLIYRKLGCCDEKGHGSFEKQLIWAGD